MAIYFIRHGETDANVANIFAGQKLDSPLTEKGLRQSQQIGEKLKALRITKIFSSNLIRTRRTALEIGDSLGIKTIHIDDRIVEYDDGVLTGTEFTELTSLELVAAKGAEDPYLFQERVLSFLREYKDSSENILMVSHGGVAKIIEASRRGIDPKLFFDLSNVANAEPMLLELNWLK